MLVNFAELEGYILAKPDDPRPVKLWNLPYNAEVPFISQLIARFRPHDFQEKFVALLVHPEIWHSEGALVKWVSDHWCYSPIGLMLVYSDLNLPAELIQDRYLAPINMCWGTPRMAYWVTGIETLWSRYVYVMQHRNLYTARDCEKKQEIVAAWAETLPKLQDAAGPYTLDLHQIL